jgi:group I intron endonuclease
MFYLYLIYNTINGKIYVGITNNPKTRWARHKSDAKSNRKQAIHCAIYKYGNDKFIFKVVENIKTLEEANLREIEWIKSLKENFYQLYNETNGGDGVSGTKWTKERKKIMSELNSGQGNPMYGVRLFGKANGNYGKSMKPHVKNTLLKYRCKITQKQAEEIRNLYSTKKYKQSELCIMYNLSPAQISRIITGKRWTAK